MTLILQSSLGTVDADNPAESFKTLENFTPHNIGRALGCIDRFNGNGLSVLDHSILCAILVGTETLQHSLIKAALMHDAQEFYLGDIAAPLIRAIPRLVDLDQTGQKAIFEHFDIPLSYISIITHYDQLALRIELSCMYGEENLPDWYNPAPIDPVMLSRGRDFVKFLLAQSAVFSESVFCAIFKTGLEQGFNIQSVLDKH